MELLFSDKHKWTIKPQKDKEEPNMHIAKGKKPICKGYITWSNDRYSVKGKNYGDTKKISGGH